MLVDRLRGGILMRRIRNVLVAGVMFAVALVASLTDAGPIGVNLAAQGSSNGAANSEQPFIDLMRQSRTLNQILGTAYGYISNGTSGTAGTILTITSVSTGAVPENVATTGQAYVTATGLQAGVVLTTPVDTVTGHNIEVLGTGRYNLAGNGFTGASIGTSSAPVLFTFRSQIDWTTQNTGGRTYEEAYLNMDANGFTQVPGLLASAPAAQQFTKLVLGLNVNLPAVGTGNSVYYPSGCYVAYYDGPGGSGSITYQGDVTGSTIIYGTGAGPGAPFGANRDVFCITTSSANGFYITVTQPTTGTAYVHNLHVMRLANEQLWLQGVQLDPGFVARMANFSAFRFMDWSNVNGSPLVAWSNRPHPLDGGYGGQTGVPDEAKIDLLNAMGKDGWINIPGLANADFIRQQAQLWHDRLNKVSRVMVESTNETWNPAFPQSEYAQQQGALTFAGIVTGYISNGTSGTAGTVLTVTGVTYGMVGAASNQANTRTDGYKIVAATNTGGTAALTVTAGTAITANASGNGGVGTYTVNNSQAVGTSVAPAVFYLVPQGNPGGPSDAAVVAGVGLGYITGNTLTVTTLIGGTLGNTASAYSVLIAPGLATGSVVTANGTGTGGTGTYTVQPQQTFASSATPLPILFVQPNFSLGRSWHGKRLANICDNWNSVWGADSARVICVLAANETDATTATESLDCTYWITGAPCYAHGFDAVAMAPYFGGSPNSTDLAAWIASGTTAGAASFISAIGTSGAATGTYHWLNYIPTYVSNYATALGPYNLPLYGYEGGAAFLTANSTCTGSVTTSGTQCNSLDLIYSAGMASTGMASVYTDYLTNAWKANGGQLLMIYNDAYPNSGGRYWGAIPSFNSLGILPVSTGPAKWSAINGFATSTPCWYIGCPHY